MKENLCNIIILLLISMIFLLMTPEPILEYTLIVINIIVVMFFAYITISKAPDLMKESLMGMIIISGIFIIIYCIAEYFASTTG